MKIRFICSSILFPLVFCAFISLKNAGIDKTSYGYFPAENLSETALLCTAPSVVYANPDGIVVDIWWAAVPTAVGYLVEIGGPGFVPGTGNAWVDYQTSSPTFFNVDILDSGQFYEVYVRAMCSNGDTSSFAGPNSFFMPISCGKHFYDTGGPMGDVLPFQSNFNMNICPSSPTEAVQLVFHELDIDPCCASLTVSNSAQTFDLLESGALPGPITEEVQGKCMMMKFSTTDGQDLGTGWDAEVKCITCPAFLLQNLYFGKVTSDAVFINFNGVLFADSIKWEIGETGFVPGTGQATVEGYEYYPVVTIVADGLESGTNYDVYFWNNCGQNISLPSKPLTFRTAPICGGLFTDPAGPDSSFINSNNISLQTTTICPDQIGWAIEAVFTEFEVGSAFFSVIFSDSPFTGSIMSFFGNNSPGILLSDHSSGCLIFEYVSSNQDPVPGWVAEINCITCPPVGGQYLEAVSLNSATVGWDVHLHADGYEWELGPPGFLPNTGAALFSGTVPSNEKKTVMAGLAPHTIYDFYIRPNCGNGDIGGFGKPFQFSTNYTCGDIFYDPGGPNSPYPNNMDLLTTICPSDPSDPVKVSFNLFNTQSPDELLVFNGPNTTANIIDILSGNEPPKSFTSTHSSGCLTFKFESDDAGVGNGWEAFVVCGVNPSIEQTDGFADMVLFPNPVLEKLTIRSTSLSVDETKLEIQDITGRIVFHKIIFPPSGNGGVAIDVRSLAVGTYFVSLLNENGAVVRRFVKY